MSIRKIKDIIDLETNELVYPKSHAKATYMSDGITVEEAINNLSLNVGGNGINIVATEDELDENAPAGTLSCVATPGTIEVISAKDLYQPTINDADMNTYTIITSGLSSVSNIEISLDSPEVEGVETMAYFCTENAPLMGGGDGAVFAIMASPTDNYISAIGGAYRNLGTQEEQEFLFYQVENSSVTVNQEQIDTFMGLFKGFELYYLGNFEKMMVGGTITPEELETIDKIVQISSGIKSTAELFLKKDKWEKQSLEFKLNDNILPIRNGVVDLGFNRKKIVEVTDSWMQISPNILYRYVGTSTSPHFYFNATNTGTVVDEYMVELTIPANTNMSISFPSSVIWANGIAPVFEPGYTYQFSIVNNLGTYVKFIKI